MMQLLKLRKIDFLIILFVIACQTTDVTIGPLKLWELIAITVFTFHVKTLDKKVLIFLSFFTYILISSIVVTAINDVSYSYYGPLKSKYMIVIVRYVELLLCLISLSALVNIIKNSRSGFVGGAKKFIDYNFLFVLFCLLLYFLGRLFSIHIFSYGDQYRLNCFYVEGGPYGLFISTVLVFEFFLFRRPSRLLVFSLALAFSYSKAGYVLFCVCFFIWIFFRVKQLKLFLEPRNRMRFLLFLTVILSLSLCLIALIARNYVENISNIDEQLSVRSSDPSLVMGRIAASYIGSNIISENPLLGVGLGNYSLVRNSDIYRGVFPVVDDWDLSGLGGILTILLENGVVGLLLFFTAVVFYFKFTRDSFVFVLLFILPMLLGAQLYMIYPWLFLGFYRLYRQSEA
ncbi:O-antigen ligase family protein [Aeromonas sp. 96A]|uniref:O-antigen ligase family protein n=1 Tax=Aeromonas sp. 96A TaxID=3452730 RepID=UPI003F795AF8